MNKEYSHVLFLFSGAANRRRILEEVVRGENADTALRGANHFPGSEFIDVEETVRDMVPSWLYSLLPWQARSLVLMSRVFAYDAIIAQDDLLLGYVVSVLSRFRHHKTHWYAVAINTSVLMRRHVHHPARLFLLKTFWKSFTKIVCLSHEQLEDFVRLGILRERLVFVPFGIDADFYAGVDESHDDGIIVSVGRDLGRDYPTLLAAATLTNHPFVIVAAPKNLPASTPLPKNVTVHYNLPLADVRALYAQAHLVVIASKDADVPEGSDCSGQTVILDAMAAGKPVIATERSWITDYFTTNEIIIVPPHNAVVLAEVIELLWQDSSRLQKLAAAGRAKVQKDYSTKVFAKALGEVVSS